ncbi:sigma-w pathway protein ysdB [Metabacillus herbersteinensis]|uniref:Sigma-w pathway protein ysdB n=1 Tax=Metabacillus herbersteinensis TaxID=283816 RepID=A0ABV6G987_9BACI
MIVLLLRVLLIAVIVFLMYTAFKYLFNPRRKLERAHEQKQFYLLDDRDNVRKNFLVTYKGALFEGEKYLGTTERSFEVISIFIWTKTESKLQGLDISDFKYIEEKLKEHYPHTKVEWKSPVKEFLQKKPH